LTRIPRAERQWCSTAVGRGLTAENPDAAAGFPLPRSNLPKSFFEGWKQCTWVLTLRPTVHASTDVALGADIRGRLIDEFRLHVIATDLPRMIRERPISMVVISRHCQLRRAAAMRGDVDEQRRFSFKCAISNSLISGGKSTRRYS